MLQTRKSSVLFTGRRWVFSLVLTLSSLLYSPVFGGAVQLTNDNFDSLVAQNEVVFINFYADWCRFSQILGPVFDEAADKIAKEVTTPGRVLFGKVDCDKDTALASRFHISKYPTLKMIRNSQVAKREYRGQRSADALVEHIVKQIEDPVQVLNSLDELDSVEDKYRVMAAFLESKETPQYDTYRKVATNLRDDCKFFVGVGPTFEAQRQRGDAVIYKAPRTKFSESSAVPDRVYTGNLHSYQELSDWITPHCLPVVREITFENAEELTEEGLPFLILFHHPSDTKSVDQFTQLVQTELAEDKSAMNMLTADGVQFAHPLHHLGKAEKDLPLIAIDSFRHMYLFPDIKDMGVPGKLKSFIEDLYSGKLHREFHYGPDPTPTDNQIGQDTAPQQIAQDPHAHAKGPTTPPESTFKKLAPSRNRYTLLRDEL